MSKRRRLPAPPLVLTPYIGRFPRGGSRAERLLRLARFLEGRSLLTDGGKRSLAGGLEGRNGVVGLSLQDVRSFAHGLATELLDQEPSRWEEMADAYFKRYDRGKPRRPTHLQRLYLEWSRDLSWPGLVAACLDHPRLWREVETALGRLEEETAEVRLLRLAAACRSSPRPWLAAMEGGTPDRKGLLTLLPYLPAARPAWRLPYLARLVTEQSATPGDDWALPLLRACHITFAVARTLRPLRFEGEPLERLALGCLRGESIDPVALCSLAGYATRRETIRAAFASISPSDPVRLVSFGGRPGRSWLSWVEDELMALLSV